MSVKVTFTYEPDDSDDKDPTGVSQDEFDRMMDALRHLGADDIEFERQMPAPPHVGGGPKGKKKR